ncbi:MAG: SMI1/KNR4 family protein [Pedobacter sp.]|nr:MAG: SMI1/KNR4 family protein [Pedobacter sp.]
MEQLDRIKLKLEKLKALDKNLILFGSESHEYQLNPILSEEKIRQFEATYNVTLPAEYVAFLTKLGNGGAGPFYGLEPFENALFDDLDYKRPNSLLNPSEPFTHNQPWNEEFEPTVNEEDEEEEYERQYVEFNKNLINGVLAICNYGCGVSLNLVVNGNEYGNIWTDDRGNDGGIYPSQELGNKERITFLNWYELWLDNSLEEIANKIKETSIIHQTINAEPKIESRPWWKFW